MTIRTYRIGVPFKTVLSLRFDVKATSALTAISKVSDMIDTRCKEQGNDHDVVRGDGLSYMCNDEFTGEIHPLDFISEFSIYNGELTPKNFGDGFDVKYDCAWMLDREWLKPPNAEIPNIDIEDDKLRVYILGVHEYDEDNSTKPDPPIPDLVTGLLNSN